MLVPVRCMCDDYVMRMWWASDQRGCMNFRLIGVDRKGLTG
jgi:hypothetical protein